MIRLLINAVLLCLLVLPISCRKQEGLEPVDLKCEYDKNPIGVENPKPLLSWIIQSDSRGTIQRAYRIIVASNEGNIIRNVGDLWDSRKTVSCLSSQIGYTGKELKSGMRCWWRVCIWDKDNRKSEWSEPASWEMGLTNPGDWKARWIGYDCQSAPQLRKTFMLNRNVREARAYISGLGFYELYLNGTRIGDHQLDPAQTDYEKRVFYVPYDVTENLRQGENVIGVTLGNGWYNQSVVNHGKYGWKDVVYGRPELIFQMKVVFSDDTEMMVVSDETWKGSSGPVILNNIYAGEAYDARREQDGWTGPGFDDSKWGRVRIMTGPGGRLESQKLPPVKRMEVIKPVSLYSPDPVVFVYDMGRNFSGWVKLKLKAAEGTEIQLRFAESLYPGGMIDPASTGVYATGIVQTDRYICSGKGTETWEPRFTYHGFRYVEMTGFPGTPGIDNIEGIFVHSSVENAGTFLCSDSMMNRLHETAVNTVRSNLHGIPTDCPHRERCGWLGDAFLISDMTIFNFEMHQFWSKFINDIESSRIDGVPANIAPGRRQGGSDPDWGAAYIQLPWNLYRYYGDTSIITDHYPGMKFFMGHLQREASDNLITRGIGSLFSPGRIRPAETSIEFTSSLLYYYCARAMAGMSAAVGKYMDAAEYDSIAGAIISSFNIKFYDSAGSTYGCQENNVLALAYGMVPEGDEVLVAAELNEDITVSKNNHFYSGIFGTRYMYEILCRYGYGKTITDILEQKTFPGHGYLFSRGATTFWENWGELTFADSPMPGDQRSKSHPFYGGFDAWFYNSLGGINPDPENPGFKHIILKPRIISSLRFARSEYRSVHGLIKSEWQNKDDSWLWSVTVPANTTASAYIPASLPEDVKEGDTPASDAEGVRFVRMEDQCAVFDLG